MQATIRDTHIFFDVDGASLKLDGAQFSERPTAFVIHGGPGTDHTGPKARYSLLASKMQLVYFDHRGQGRSGRGNPQSYTLDENVKDMEALRQHLGLGPIVSIGTSYGGMVAMAHAARYPEAVSHLVLISTAAHAGYIDRAQQIVAEQGSADQNAMCRRFFAGEIDSRDKLRQYFDIMGPLYSRKYNPQSEVGLEWAILEPVALNRAHGPGGFLRDFDLRSELPSIVAPTLVLAGRHDWICAPEFSEEIQTLIPGSDLRIFEQSGHTIGTDEQQRCIDAIAGFIVYNRSRRGV